MTQPLASAESLGGTCDQARHRKRRCDDDKHQPHQGRAGRRNRLRIAEKRARPRPAHRAPALWRLQREAPQDGHRPQPTHRRRGEYSAWQGGAVQAWKRAAGNRRIRKGLKDFFVCKKSYEIPVLRIWRLWQRPDTRWCFRYTKKLGAVPKWPKGEVCKTSIRGFESHPRLQARRLCGFREPLSPLRHEKGRSFRPTPFVRSIFLGEFSSFPLAIAASPRQGPCKVAQDSGTRCRGPAPGSVGR